MPRFLILGAGFTGQRVAERLRNRGFDVTCTTRANFDACRPDRGLLRDLVEADTAVLHSIPTLHTQGGLWEPTPALVEAFALQPPARIVYLSTTGVYGDQRLVNEETPGPAAHGA